MNDFFKRDYNLRYFEMNKHGMASPVTILTLLEETAADHCLNIGYSLYDLEKQNIGWVLTSGVIEMTRYPKYKENITVLTWLSKYTLVRGYRENLILDEDENIIGKAKGRWVFYDIQNRKPIPIFDDIIQKWKFNLKSAIEENPELINQGGEGDLKNEFCIYRSDIDSYKHVSNIRYLHFLLESLPEDFLDKYFLKTINAKFFSEAKFGDKIQVYIDDNLGNNNFLHTMKNNADNKKFARAHTQWENIVS